MMKKITLLFACLTCAIGFQGYGQNSCDTAVAVADGVTNTTTIVDGSAGAEMGLADGGEDSAWYSYTPTADGAINIGSCLGGSDTRVFVGTGTCGSLTVVDANDDSCDLGDGDNYASQVLNLPVTMGVTYYIEWDDRWEDGTFDWTLNFVAFTPPPANDVCPDANVVNTLPYNFSQTDGIGSTNNSGFIAACAASLIGGMNDGLWFTFTPATSGAVDIAVTNVDGWDPQLDLYSGSCATLTCVSNADEFEISEGETILAEDVVAGTQYFINVGFYSESNDMPEGNFDISITGTFTLSLDKFENANTFTYFPNPVKNTLSLKAQSNIQKVSILNMLGQEVLRFDPNALVGDINMNPLQSGAYFVKVTVNDATETIRVIKQ